MKRERGGERAEYLTTVTDPNLRKALTMYRLSEHKGQMCDFMNWYIQENQVLKFCSIAIPSLQNI